MSPTIKSQNKAHTDLKGKRIRITKIVGNLLHTLLSVMDKPDWRLT